MKFDNACSWDGNILPKNIYQTLRVNDIVRLVFHGDEKKMIGANIM
jgi:hypothetical protein